MIEGANMAAPLDCPEIDCWQEFLLDTLPSEQEESLERHLETCVVCQERLHRAEWCEEALRSVGQQFGDPTIMPPDPTLAEMLDRLRQTNGQNLAAFVEPAELQFLGEAERPDVLGTIDTYEVLEVIGRGGMGVVLKALDPALNRNVAIKVLAPFLAWSPTARLRFTREAQAAAAVVHKHVVAVHSVSEVDGLPYLVMQYIDGESLQSRLDRVESLPVEEIVEIGNQIAAGLAAAHEGGLIHRDIKPANILLVSDGRSEAQGLQPLDLSATHHSPLTTHHSPLHVKITDFGLARMADDVGLTQNGVLAGTPEYMAPEQARGERIDHRADLFSLGSVMYALCTGTPPFGGSSTVAVLRQVSDEQPRPIRSLNPDVPAWLEALIGKLLAKDPDERFQSAAQVAALLEGFLAHLRQPELPAPELAPSVLDRRQEKPPSGLRAQPFPGLPSWFWLPVVLLLAAVGLGLGWHAVVGGGTEPKPGAFAEYHRSFCEVPANRDGMELVFGPEAEELVHFEPEGMRIALPAGHAGEREDTGLTSSFGVRGNFDITVGFDILQESRPTDQDSVRVTLTITLDRPGQYMASLSRNQSSRHGGSTFMSWHCWRNEPGEKNAQRVDLFPTRASSGRLRMARIGSMLSFFAAEGPTAPFRFLCRYSVGTEDLRTVGISGSTRGTKGALDVRITDLRIRGESLPGAPAALVVTSRKAEPAHAIGLLWLALPLALLPVLALLLYAGHSRNPLLRGSHRWFRRWLWIPTVVLTVAAAGFVVWDLLPERTETGPAISSTDATVKSAEGENQDPKADRGPTFVRQDLRGQKLMEPFFHATFPVPGQKISEEPEGLRIALPANVTSQPRTGVVSGFAVRGDCEITTSFELLREEHPKKGWGGGASLIVGIDNTSYEKILLACMDRPGGLCYKCQKMYWKAGKEQYTTRIVKSTARSGKLRLVRQGANFTFLVAERDNDTFRELHRYETGKEDITFIQAGAENISSDTPVEIRLRDLEIKTANPIEKAWLDPKATESTAEEPPRYRPRPWLKVMTLVCLVIALALLVALRLGPIPRPTSKPQPETTDAKGVSITFSCQGCRTSLRTRAELAGKRIKCPRCGKPVQVPIASAIGSERASG
jgi:serine/threonine-protein kinase